MERRRFIRDFFLGLASASAFPFSRSGFGAIRVKSREFYITGTGPMDPPGIHIEKCAPDFPASVSLWWPDRSAVSRIPIGFRPHGFEQNPAHPSQIATFHKWGRNFAVVDALKETVLAKARYGDDFRCFGHGLYSPDGSTLFVAACDDRNDEAFIDVRDAITLREIGRIPSFGKYTHELHWADPGKVIIAANIGSRRWRETLGTPQAPLIGTRSGLSWIDVRARKLIRQIEFDNPRIRIGHFGQAPSGEILAMGLLRFDGVKSPPGWAALVFPDGRYVELTPPQEAKAGFIGEVLSVAASPKNGVFATTCSGSESIYFWDIRTGAFKGVRKAGGLGCGMAITADGKYFVSSDFEGRLNWFRTDSLDWEAHSPSSFQSVAGNGSHLYRMTV